MLLSYSTEKEMNQSLFLNECLFFVHFPCRNVDCISLEQAEEKLISVGRSVCQTKQPITGKVLFVAAARGRWLRHYQWTFCLHVRLAAFPFLSIWLNSMRNELLVEFTVCWLPYQSKDRFLGLNNQPFSRPWGYI